MGHARAAGVPGARWCEPAGPASSRAPGGGSSAAPGHRVRPAPALLGGDRVTSDRDRHAARLSRQRWSYTEIAEHLGYPDRRAAHRGVQRGLAEPAEDEALWRGLRVKETDDQLLELQRGLFVLLERHESYPATMADARVHMRIFDTLFRVSLVRCRLHGLFVHPWRCDQWWRRDVPFDAWVHPQRQANRLEREARIPLRRRTVESAPCELAPVRPVSVLVEVESLVPVTVRRLLDRVA